MILMQTDVDIPIVERLIDVLQSCFSFEEACTIIQPLMQQLFPNEAGAIYVVSSSKNLLKAIATWGPTPLTSDPVFTPHECHALRRGRVHLVEDTHHGLICQHIRPNSLPVETFCIPMMAHGETLGVLSISSLRRGQITTIKQLALQVAKYLGLALANLKLRESIKNQSLRDPLTKLYNRRYLEESLEREIQRSERHLQPLGIILFEVDRVEYFNETFGYGAGDCLLREVGAFLAQQIYALDIACRYQGEQFLLLLPETSLVVTQQRAEQLRQTIKQLTIQYKRQTLDSITIACGIASFPEPDLTSRELIQAAYAALNCAKEQGGDRVCTASSAVQSVEPETPR
jgi:diguanylate cyclase (GGDEF)-like protein